MDRIFFCFSGKDRLVYAESSNFHLKNLGIEVWYDYEKLYLGDDGDYVNIEEGLERSNIFLIFISKNLFQSTGALLELAALRDKVARYHDITIIPILCGIMSSDIPKEYHWISDYIYGEMTLDISTGTYDLSIDILKRLLKEKLKTVEIKDLLSIDNIKENFIDNLIKSYNMTDKNCFLVRITLLYTMILYYLEKFNIQNDILFCSTHFIFNKVRLNIQPTIKEIACMESILLLLVSQSRGNLLNNMQN